MRYRLVQVLFIIVALLVSANGAGHGADRVELSSGEVFYGRVLKNTEEEVAIQLGTGGVLTFRRSNVKHVRRAGDDSAESETPVESSEPKKEKAGDSQQIKPAQPTPIEKELRTTESKQATNTKPPLQPDAPETLLTLAQQRVAVAPPRGFRQKGEEPADGANLSFWDPATGATFTMTMTSQRSEETVEELKKQALQTYGRVFSAFKILRNERLKKGDKEVKPETWIVESECQTGKETHRHIQVFVRREDDFFVLTYDARQESYETYRESFEKSLGSLRFLEATEGSR